MSELIFLDTEATGNEPSKDRLCQVCYKTSPNPLLELGEGGDVVQMRSSYFNPPIPISVKAMSVTHITNKIPEHNIQYLRYFLELEVPGTAHDAEGDVNVLEALFKRLYTKLSSPTS